MDLTLRAPIAASEDLTGFWADYFNEIPTCTCNECSEVAIEVDPYFPYLDDFNRCAGHILKGASQPASVS